MGANQNFMRSNGSKSKFYAIKWEQIKILCDLMGENQNSMRFNGMKSKVIRIRWQ